MSEADAARTHIVQLAFIRLDLEHLHSRLSDFSQTLALVIGIA